MDNEEMRRAMGRRLADARAKVGMSQADLGAVIGVSGPRVSHFESGHSLPRASYRIPIAKALKVDPDALFGPEIFLPRERRRPVRKLMVSKTMGRKPMNEPSSSVSRQIVRLIEGMSGTKRQLALSLLRSISRSRLLK